MRVVKAFYELTLDGNGVPPSARQLSEHMDLDLSQVYLHLHRGADYGLIKKEFTPGKGYGKRGFLLFLPLVDIA